MSLNKLFLLGRLGKDVELKDLESDKKVAKFSLATDHGFGDKKVTDWHNVVVWDKLAENCQKFLKKGSKVLIEGRVTNRSWEADGVKKYITEVVAHNVQFLDPVKLEDVVGDDSPAF